eukprot:PhF_6_TR15693/c0_g1_i2/m.24417
MDPKFVFRGGVYGPKYDAIKTLERLHVTPTTPRVPFGTRKTKGIPADRVGAPTITPEHQSVASNFYEKDLVDKLTFYCDEISAAAATSEVRSSEVGTTSALLNNTLWLQQLKTLQAQTTVLLHQLEKEVMNPVMNGNSALES